MKKNQSKRIYNKSTKTWIEVSEEFYQEHTRYYDTFRKRAQHRGQCACPKSKFWLCDGDCLKCEFHCAGNMLSLDCENSRDDTRSWLDSMSDMNPLIEDIISDKMALQDLFARLEELMPEAKIIGQLRLNDLSDNAIADIIGIKRTTFRSRLNKVKEILVKEYPDFF